MPTEVFNYILVICEEIRENTNISENDFLNLEMNSSIYFIFKNVEISYFSFLHFNRVSKRKDHKGHCFVQKRVLYIILH